MRGPSNTDKIDMEAWKNWPERFGIDSEHAAAFEREGHGEAMSPGNLAKFFTWCIEKGLIDQQEAAQFVAEVSAKPIVNSAFFDQPIDPQVWELVKGVHTWSPTLVPLGYWDDHLLLGTPLPPWESPPLRKLRTPPMIVVAPALDLQNYFERLSGQTDPWTVSSNQPIGPMGLDESDPNVSVALPPGEQTVAAFHLLRESTQRPDLNDADAVSMISEPETSAASVALASEPSLPAAPKLAPPRPITETVTETATENENTKPELSKASTLMAKSPAPADDLFAALAASAGVELNSDSSPESHEELAAPAPADEMPEGLDFGLQASQQAETEVSASFSPPETSSEDVAQDPTADTNHSFDSFEAHLPPPPPPQAPPPFVSHKPAPVVETPVEQVSAEKVESQDSSGPKDIHRTRVHDFDKGHDEIVEAPQALAPDAPAVFTSETLEIGPGLSLDNITMSDLPMPSEDDAPPTSQVARQIASDGEAGSRVLDLESTMSGARVNRQDPTSNKVVNISSLEPQMLDDCHTFDQIGAQVLLQIHGTFDSGMILLFQGGQLVPWKWSDLLLSVKGDNPDPIDLDHPSVFKVAYRSALPYHGYVVTNATNQKFFNEFTRGMLPKHMTVMPVMIEKQMCGLLVAISQRDVQVRQSLRTMERLAFELSRAFKRLRGAKPQAAA